MDQYLDMYETFRQKAKSRSITDAAHRVSLFRGYLEVYNAAMTENTITHEISLSGEEPER